MRAPDSVVVVGLVALGTLTIAACDSTNHGPDQAEYSCTKSGLRKTAALKSYLTQSVAGSRVFDISCDSGGPGGVMFHLPKSNTRHPSDFLADHFGCRQAGASSEPSETDAASREFQVCTVDRISVSVDINELDAPNAAWIIPVRG